MSIAIGGILAAVVIGASAQAEQKFAKAFGSAKFGPSSPAWN